MLRHTGTKRGGVRFAGEDIGRMHGRAAVLLADGAAADSGRRSARQQVQQAGGAWRKPAGAFGAWSL